MPGEVVAEAPQAAPQGEDVVKQAAAGIQSQAETLMQAAGALKEAGAPGAEKIAQAAELMMSALADMGAGGAPQQGPTPVAGADPNVAGAAGPVAPVA
jgi:hypothetical protein